MEMFNEFAKSEGASMSDLLRNATFEKLQDQYNIKIVEEALQEHQKAPRTTTLKDAMKQYNL